MSKMFPVIDLEATGENITRLRKACGLTVRDLQNWFGFEEPQAIYKWQKGKSLPTVDNLYALGTLLDVPMEEILVPCKPQLNIVSTGQQDVSCCPPLFLGEFMRLLERREAGVDVLQIGTENASYRSDFQYANARSTGHGSLVSLQSRPATVPCCCLQ